MSDPDYIESWLPKSEYSFIMILDAQTGWIIQYDDYAYANGKMEKP